MTQAHNRITQIKLRLKIKANSKYCLKTVIVYE